jgi:hypothetical protein
MIDIFVAAANANDASNNGLVRMIIQMMAYVTPFFLIPATFKFGLGVFSNFAGMVNDRSRGFFDGQRKKRMEVRAGNKQRMRDGQRFNNRALNAFTSQASTGGIPFTRKRAALYQQKMNNAGNAFAKSEQAQGVQHNDGALQALTYGSAIEARAGMERGDFGAMSASQISDSIAAAKASGGFGRDRQVWAAAQLSRTGTGYSDLGQVADTIARVSHGNAGQAAALAGDINASTKQVGRSDLAPGFGHLNALAQASMSGKGTYRTEDGEERQIDFSNKSVRDQALDQAAYEATASVDHMSAARNKGPGYKNNVRAVVKRLQANPDDADAQARLHDMINAGAYGSPANQEALREEISNVTRSEANPEGHLNPVFATHVQNAMAAAAAGRVAPDDRLTNPPGAGEPPAPGA